MYHEEANARFAYCKYGDVVAQLDALGARPEHIPDGGPDTYAANFLRFSNGRPVLMISYSSKTAVKLSGNVIARTYKKNYKMPLFRGIAWLFILVRTFHYLMRFNPTHILCAASGTPLWACFLVSRIMRIPLIHTRHARFSDNSYSFLNILTEKIDVAVIRRASSIICHGPYLREQMLALGVRPDKLYEYNISYRYLLDDTNGRLHEVPDITDDSRYRCIMFVGTVTKQKGVYDLYKACKVLLESDRNVRLVYVGKGPDYENLLGEIQNDALEKQVIMLGHIHHSILPMLIKQSVFLVTPTRSSYPESRCKAAIEGMVLGRPVIAPDFGPFPYVFKHGYNGLLYKADSVTDLREKIRSVLSNDALYSDLVKGAHEEGKKLLDASLSFQQALQLAFGHTK